MKSKTVLYVVLVIFLLAALGGGLWLLRRQQVLRSNAAPASTLSLQSSNSTPQQDQTFTVNVNIDTGANNVIGTELFILFDKTKLSAEAAVPGSFFTGPQEAAKTLDNNTGQINYTLYLPTGSTPVRGPGTVATLTFKALTTGPATISFKSPDTIVGGTGEGGQNVLVSATEASVTIQAAGGGAAPTATPSPSPAGAGGSPTPTPLSTATLTPTPTTKAGGTGSGGLTPTPTVASSGSGTSGSTTTTGGTSASGSGTQLPNTATPTQTALGILAGILLIAVSVFLKLRRAV